MKMDMKDASGFYVMGHFRGDDLPPIATDALAEGFDSASLRVLAGEMNPAMSDAGPLFERSLAEIGLRLPTKQEAALIIGKHYARRILRGDLTPYEGAVRIWYNVSNRLSAPCQVLLHFVGAASEIEDIPERGHLPWTRRRLIRQYEEDIKKSARELTEIEDAEQLAAGYGSQARRT